MTESNDILRFNELLPFYVNQTLGETDRRWMEDFVSAHPEMRHRVRVEERLRQVVKATQSLEPETVRLERLLQDFREDHPKEAFWQTLITRVMRPYSIPAPAIAMTAVLVITQALMLASEDKVPIEDLRLGAHGERSNLCEQLDLLRVVFKPDITQTQLVEHLRAMHLSITEGPSANGEFLIRIPKDSSRTELKKRLSASGLVLNAFTDEPIDIICQK